MGRWFRCPICGHYCLERNIERDFPLQVFNQVGLGRAKGFRYDPIEDLGILQRLKNKIKFLYEVYFVENKIKLRVPTIPSILLRDNVELSLDVPIIVKSEVKMVG